MIKPSPSQVKSWIKQHFGNDFKTAKNGAEIRINNPLSIDNGYHLWINIKKSMVNDFRPNYKSSVRGTFISFVMKYRSIGFKEAVREVMGDVDFKSQEIFYEDSESPSGPVQEVVLPDDFHKFTYDDNLISSTVKRYLNNRCISNGKMYVLGVGYCGTNVVFPYYEFRKVVYWQQRSIIDKRFLFPEAPKTKFIYGIDSIDPTDPVIATESIFNSLMFDNGIAIGGSDFSNDQKQKLKRQGVKKLILAFDNDGAGRAGVVKSYEKLNPYFDLYYSLTDGEPDWNDIAIQDGPEEPLRMLKRNVKKLDFKASIKLKRGI
jgi:DNA primase